MTTKNTTDHIHYNDRRFVLWDRKRDGVLRYPDENYKIELNELGVPNA